MQPDDYTAHRPMIVRIAYDITGSWADAEDVAQQTSERWLAASDVREPRAYLARIATNLAIDALRATSRVEYRGPFLPEPVAPDLFGNSSDEDLDAAVLVVLQSLSPLERAIFVLHDVFGFTFEEVAEAVDREPAAVRQTGARARRAVEARRPRRRVSSEELERTVQRFAAASASGEIEALIEQLAPDVTLITDGGGRISAAGKPVEGARKVAKFLMKIAPEPGNSWFEITEFSGLPAVAFHRDGRLDSVIWMALDDEDRIAAAWVVRNPDKLTRLTAPRRV